MDNMTSHVGPLVPNNSEEPHKAILQNVYNNDRIQKDGTQTIATPLSDSRKGRLLIAVYVNL